MDGCCSISYLAEVPCVECRQPLSAEVNAKLLQEAKWRGPMFREPFQTLLDHSDVATLMVFNAMDKDGFSHGPSSGIPDGIVFIGDSNHAVSPFAGDGANLALNDGFDLADCLCTCRSVAEAVQEYDKRALKRASSSLEFSHELIAIAHTKGWTWTLYQTAFSLLGMALPLWYKCEDFLYRKNSATEPHANTKADPPASTTSFTLAYRTAGNRDHPAVLMPTCFSGRLRNTFPWLYINSDSGTPPVLAKYFVIIVGMLGGSESSSPSNAHPSMRGLDFPKVSIADNIHLQHALCLALGVNKLAAYIGNSTGGLQAYHMGVMYPDFVERLEVLTGAASASWHNISFLDGPKAALVNSVDFHDGHYTQPADRGTGAFGRVCSTWALSSSWFRAKKWEELGYTSMLEYLETKWEKSFRKWDAHDLLCMLDMWQRADVSLHGPVKGDLVKALASIKAMVLVMPSRTDLYSPPEDSLEEVRHLQHGELKIIETVWGHVCGGGGGSKEDTEFIKSCIEEMLAQEVEGIRGQRL